MQNSSGRFGGDAIMAKIKDGYLSVEQNLSVQLETYCTGTKQPLSVQHFYGILSSLDV